MEQQQEIVVGLDIGTTKIACLIGKRDADNPGKIKIIGHGKVASVGVVHGVVKNILEAANSIKQAVSDAAEEAKCPVTEVYVGIASQHIRTQENRGTIIIPEGREFITEEDVERLIKEQENCLQDPGYDIVHIFPQNYIVDNEDLNGMSPIGVPGKQLAANFHIVMANRTEISNILRSVRRAGLKEKGIVLEPVASAMAVLSKQDLDAGVTLVDIGGGTTDVAIFTEGVIRHTRVIPLAGNTITDDIMKGCQVIRDTAERLKVNYGSCMPECVPDQVVTFPSYRNESKKNVDTRTLASIIKGRVTDIIDLVQLEIAESGTGNQLVGGIVLTGGGAKLKDMVNFTAYKTGIDTRVGTPDEHLSDFTGKRGEGLSDPIFSTGIGLVLYGFSELDATTKPKTKDKETDNFGPEILDDGSNEEEKTGTTTEPEINTPEPDMDPSKPKWYDSIKNFFNSLIEKGDDDFDNEK